MFAVGRGVRRANTINGGNHLGMELSQIVDPPASSRTWGVATTNADGSISYDVVATNVTEGQCGAATFSHDCKGVTDIGIHQSHDPKLDMTLGLPRWELPASYIRTCRRPYDCTGPILLSYALVLL